MSRVFLSAEWRWLVLLNYAVDPAVLHPLLPHGVELDLWHDRALVSMVGFRFVRTRVSGVAVPWHRDFDEVNLRFYVRRRVAGDWRRGVVFVKEIVPRPAIALVARLLFGERYVALPMRHAIAATVEPPRRAIDYAWRVGGRWHRLWATTGGPGEPAEPGSEAEFITEHYWGYARRARATVEYRVEHPRWSIWTAAECGLDADVGALYGPGFAESLRGPPLSAYVADGSPVAVRYGRRLP
ncbi:MAG: DUF2071 domain-containing protein [Chloroflexi bacterium]|nr:DUF2071 domain-containing protein [Chloroflexota bacterium]